MRAPLLIPSLLIVALVTGIAAAQAQILARPQVTDDRDSADRNAVVFLGHCSGTLITEFLVLTAAHCVLSQFREARPPDDRTRHCARLPIQHKIQDHAWEDPMKWHLVPRSKPLRIALGDDRTDQRNLLTVRAYTIARCADIALLQLVRRASPALVTPMKVLVEPRAPGDDLDAYLRAAHLRYVGWGLGEKSARELPHRQTGPASYWDRTACLLYTLPPRRPDGKRVVKGDSGSPLILRENGTDYVIGVLLGSGLPDHEACGLPLLPPPDAHGAYTPTFRGALTGTDATDIAAWLRHMAPDAAYPPRPAPAQN